MQIPFDVEITQEEVKIVSKKKNCGVEEGRRNTISCGNRAGSVQTPFNVEISQEEVKIVMLERR